MFKILLEKLKTPSKKPQINYSGIGLRDEDTKVFIGNFNRYSGSQEKFFMVLDNINLFEEDTKEFIYVNEYHFSNIINIGEHIGKIKQTQKVIFTAKFNPLAERENYYNNKELFTDVKIINYGY